MNKLMKYSILNYISYGVQSYLLLILIKVFGSTNKNLFGFYLTFIFGAELLAPIIKNVFSKNSIKQNFILFGIVYLITFILLSVSLFLKILPLFIIFMMLNVLFYKTMMIEYKLILQYENHTVDGVANTGKWRQTMIEIGYGIGMLFLGALLEFGNVLFLILWDLIFKILFITFTMKEISNREYPIKHKEKNNFSLKGIMNIKFVVPIIIIIIGNLYFCQDDSVVSQIFSEINYGILLYGIYTLVTGIFGIISLHLVTKIVKNQKYRIYFSNTLMFVSLIMISIFSGNTLIVMICGIISGLGVTTFLGCEDGYLVECDPKNKNNWLVFVEMLYSIMHTITPVIFLTTFNVFGKGTFNGLLIGIFVVFLISILFDRRKKLN